MSASFLWLLEFQGTSLLKTVFCQLGGLLSVCVCIVCVCIVCVCVCIVCVCVCVHLAHSYV